MHEAHVWQHPLQHGHRKPDNVDEEVAALRENEPFGKRPAISALQLVQVDSPTIKDFDSLTVASVVRFRIQEMNVAIVPNGIEHRPNENRVGVRDHGLGDAWQKQHIKLCQEPP
jgi:hypothetical protein